MSTSFVFGVKCKRCESNKETSPVPYASPYAVKVGSYSYPDVALKLGPLYLCAQCGDTIRVNQEADLNARICEVLKVLIESCELRVVEFYEQSSRVFLRHRTDQWLTCDVSTRESHLRGWERELAPKPLCAYIPEECKQRPPSSVDRIMRLLNGFGKWDLRFLPDGENNPGKAFLKGWLPLFSEGDPRLSTANPNVCQLEVNLHWQPRIDRPASTIYNRSRGSIERV